jgi:hypothetical protein
VTEGTSDLKSSFVLHKKEERAQVFKTGCQEKPEVNSFYKSSLKISKKHQLIKLLQLNNIITIMKVKVKKQL